MRHKALTLAVAALLAFGASGVVAASISPSPSTATAAQSPADPAPSANHTVEVVDPHDRLSAQDVKKAWHLAWANETVKSYVDDTASVHFHVEAVGDELQVYVAPNSTAAPRVQAVVDLSSKAVVTVDELSNVATADEAKTMTLSPQKPGTLEKGETTTVWMGHTSDAEIGTADESITLNVPKENLTVVEDSLVNETEASTVPLTLANVSEHYHTNYTIEVIDPHDQLSADEVEAAWQLAWANEDVRSYFEDGASVHFEVWAPQPDENRTVVSVAPADAPDKSRVLATVHLDHPAGERVTDIKEPTVLNASTARSITLTGNGTFSVGPGDQRAAVDDDEPTELETGESITFEVDVGNTDAEVISVHLDPDDQTVVTEDGNTTLAPAE